MPGQPRIIPIECPFGAGGVAFVYYIDAPEPALVDTGVAASPSAMVEPALNAVGLSLKNVRWILATHGHWDHIGGAHAARRMAADDVKVALHTADRGLLGSRRLHIDLDGYQGLRFKYLDDPEALARHDALLMENLSGELAADRELHGGERISLGGDVTLEVVHTPGHSPGSASFLLDGSDWLFSGDAVQVHGSSNSGFPLFVDPRAYRATQLRLLDDVRPKRLYMGHHFRGLDGATIMNNILDGPAIEAALRDSLTMHERLAEAAGRVVSLDLERPHALALAPAAEALGYPSDQPAAWPSSLFATLHGFLRAAAEAPAAR